MNENLPLISLELNSGLFRIKTDSAIYQIEVNVNGQAPARPAAPQAPAPAAPPQDPASAEYFQEVSEEMYKSIGNLARELSLSIREIPSEGVDEMDLKETGVQLEDAKDQLEKIVEITEKATMDIMDLTESILEDTQSVYDNLGTILNIEFMAEAPENLPNGEAAEGGWEETAEEDINGFLGALMDKGVELKAMLEGLGSGGQEDEPAPAQPPRQVVQVVKEYHFDLDALMQTIYEFCTNETVKSHIKAMRGDLATAFDQEKILAALAELAPTLPAEDGFFDFPLAQVLKILAANTASEKYQKIIQKMHQTIASIFLESTLPIEGEVREKEVPVDAAEPQAPAAASQEAQTPPWKLEAVLGALDETIGMIDKKRAALAEGKVAANYSMVRNTDRKAIITAVESSHQILQAIINHITHILEALSFQDLSGQRILKIVKLISHVQVQLLSLLVSFGAKLKKRQAALSPEGSGGAIMAQDDVDRMLESVTVAPMEGPGAEGRLDQDAVDSMLAKLGF